MPTQTDTWQHLPGEVRDYLVHVLSGASIRDLARATNCHASTISRRIRKIEARRDDPLIDAALKALEADLEHGTCDLDWPSLKGNTSVNTTQLMKTPEPDVQDDFERNAIRILRRLCETGAVLAVASDMDMAVVVREDADGQSTRTAVVSQSVAQTLALKNWISTATSGRILRYSITPAGRTALQDMLHNAPEAQESESEGQADFADQHRTWGEREIRDEDSGQRRRVRYNLAESPMTALARRRDKDGSQFLSPDLVRSGERLREDFELAQMGQRVTQNWEKFLTGHDKGSFNPSDAAGHGPEAAKARVMAALSDLGPGLSDVALRCCCYLEGLETAEKKMGWSARSGKIVLRIALQRLKRHYEENLTAESQMIG